MAEGFRGGCRGRHNLNPEAMLPQTPQDVVFHSEVVGHDRNVRRWQRFALLPRVGLLVAHREFEARALLVLLVPAERFRVRDFFDVIHAHESGPILRAPDGLRLAHAISGNETVERPAHAQLPGQRARVHLLQARNAVPFEIFRQRKIRAPVAHHR